MIIQIFYAKKELKISEFTINLQLTSKVIK